MLIFIDGRISDIIWLALLFNLFLMSKHLLIIFIALLLSACDLLGLGPDPRIAQKEADAKIKLRHGPIPKLDMPAMTMVFRVANAALLEQVTEGEEVGVTIEKIGSAYVVTGIQR